MSQPTSELNPRDLFTLLNFAWAGQAVYVAAQLQLADLVSHGPRSVEELARSCEVDVTRLGQVLRALASLGIFATDSTGRYRITPLAAQLKTGSWLRSYALLWGEQLYPAGGKLLEMLRRPETGFELAHGRSLYEQYRNSPADSQRFVDFMAEVTDWQRDELVGRLDLAGFRSVVDVGGGRAGFLTAVLRANEHLEGIVFDQPHMQQAAEETIAAAGVESRCRFVGGNFLEEAPPGADLYILKHVLHDWDDAGSRLLLQSIRRAMRDDSVFMIIEAVLSPANGADALCKFRDLEQLFWTGGQVRTRQQLNDLLAAAELTVESICPSNVLDASIIRVRSESQLRNNV